MKIKRNIINIDETLCNGCGLCTQGCYEGALQLIDGKAKLISELYCDGLGACIGECPVGAISIVEKEVEPYDEIAVMDRIAPQGAKVIEAHLRHLKKHGENQLFQQAIEYLREHKIAYNPMAIIEHSCPGTAQKVFSKTQNHATRNSEEINSELTHWPIQLHLINPQSEHFRGEDLLLAADCTAFSLGGFHSKLLRNKKLAIACPKLDNGKESYIDKLTQLIEDAQINTLTIAVMEVPCCNRLLQLAKIALEKASRKIPIKKIVISIQGKVIEETWI